MTFILNTELIFDRVLVSLFEEDYNKIIVTGLDKVINVKETLNIIFDVLDKRQKECKMIISARNMNRPDFAHLCFRIKNSYVNKLSIRYMNFDVYHITCLEHILIHKLTYFSLSKTDEGSSTEHRTTYNDNETQRKYDTSYSIFIRLIQSAIVSKTLTGLGYKDNIIGEDKFVLLTNLLRMNKLQKLDIRRNRFFDLKTLMIILNCNSNIIV